MFEWIAMVEMVHDGYLVVLFFENSVVVLGLLETIRLGHPCHSDAINSNRSVEVLSSGTKSSEILVYVIGFDGYAIEHVKHRSE